VPGGGELRLQGQVVVLVVPLAVVEMVEALGGFKQVHGLAGAVDAVEGFVAFLG
jgi:hypothetical protein